MPYIGRELDRGNYLKLDDISSTFNGSTTTFNLTNGGKAFYPGSAFSILVVLAGVVQEPEAAYQINQAQITFASAPLAGDQFFCIVLGQALGVNTPANGSVNGAQLAKPFNYDNYFYLDDANNRVGIATATPQKPLHVVGEGQFDSVRVLGDLTVEGTTSTLDTVVTEVDKLEVSANNSTVGVAITQSGTGDIFNLYDGTTQVVRVEDGGNFVVGGTNSGGWKSKIQVANNASYQAALNITNQANADFNVEIKTSETRIGTSPNIPLLFKTNNTERLRITSDGKVGVGEDNVQAHFHIAKNIADSDAINWTGSQLSVATEISGNSTANRATIYFAPYGSDNNYAPSAISASAGTSGASTLKFFTNASGNLTGQVQSYERLRITSDGKVRVPDNGKFVAGAGDDLQIYHNATNSHISNQTGGLYIDQNLNDGDIFLRSDNGTGGLTGYLVCDGSSGAVRLNHYGAQKLETASTGILVTGQVNASTMHLTDGNGIHIGNSNDLRIYHDGNNSAINDVGTGNLYIQGSDSIYFRDYDTSENHMVLNKNGSVDLYHNGSQKFETTSDGATITGELGFASGGTYQLKLSDNQKIRFGGGNDLQIYHDGSHSYINQSTAGNLYITHGSETMIGAFTDGKVELRYDNSTKFETTTTGAKVTGALEVTQEYPSIRPTLDQLCGNENTRSQNYFHQR